MCHHQFRFRESHNITHVATDIYNQILQNLDLKKYTIALFSYLQKAFDAVDHGILHKKLRNYEIRGNMLNLLKDYLSNRSQFTTTYRVTSVPNLLKTENPQGPKLGSLLFLIYINQLPSTANITTRLFADNTCLSLSRDNIETLSCEANKELNKVNKWMIENKLCLSFTKTKYMLFKPSKNKLGH